MKLEDLQLIFRSSSSAPVETQSYIVSLLNKFEVALTWDSRTLLIPSLLPTEEQTLLGLPGSDVRVKVIHFPGFSWFPWHSNILEWMNLNGIVKFLLDSELNFRWILFVLSG